MFASLPPLALAGSYELVVRERRRRRTATEPRDGGEGVAAPTAVSPNGQPRADRSLTAGSRPAAPVKSGRGDEALSDVVAGYLTAASDRSVHDGQLTTDVAERLAVSVRTARRRLQPLRATGDTS